MIEESTRPYISVYTDEINTGNPLFYLIIKNFGKSPAYITKFESDFDFRGCYKIPTDKDYLGNLKNAVFAPGQSRICMLDYAKIRKEITFTLEYHSGAKKKYSEKFTIDLKAGVSMPYGKAATEGKELRTISYTLQTSVYKGYKQDKIEMRGDRAEMSDFPLYLNTVAGGLDRRDQTIGGFSFIVKIYAVPVVEIIG